MELSIVTTLYCSEPHIKEFCNRMIAAAQKITPDFELILVNDGSPDNSLTIALALYHTHHNIKIIDLSRNFCHHKAMMTGLMHAGGERVFLIDCDLEEPPEVLDEWSNQMNADADLDVVYGVQSSREGSWFKRISGWIFYRLINAFSTVKLPVNTLTFLTINILCIILLLIFLKFLRKKYLRLSAICFLDYILTLFG